MHRETLDAYVARDILYTVLGVIRVLEEFHPYPLVYSADVKRFVRHLFLIEHR